MIYGGLGDSTDLSCAIEGRGREGWLKVGAHVGYEDDAQEQIQPLPVLVLHLLRPLLRHGCAARGSPPPSVCAGNLGSSCFFMGSSCFCLARSRVHQLRLANSFLVGLIIGLGLAVSSSTHLIFFVLKWAQPIDPLVPVR